MRSRSRRIGPTSVRDDSFRGLCTLALAGAVAVAPGSAFANGRFPAANQIVFEPDVSSHILVNTTFGLLDSRDAGKTFAWQCESALAIAGQQDTMAAVTAGGSIVAGTFDGIVVSQDGCTFAHPPELVGRIVPDLALIRSAPHELLAFHMVGIGSAQYDSQVIRSIDDGQSWTNVGSPLPVEVLPLTIDVAPTDPLRVYLSGRLGTADAYASVLMRSADGGVTFERVLVPGTTIDRMAYIAAIHPLDPSRVYVRVDDTAGTVIWSSEDGGQSLRKRFTGSGRLPGFAMSPDGTEIALGGTNDGTWVGATDGTTFERRSDVAPSCLAWNASGLYACADARQDGFSVGLSGDRAATFEPVLQFASLCGGRTACGADTDVGRKCPGEWPLVAPSLGSSCGLTGPQPMAGRASCECSLSPARATGGRWWLVALLVFRLRRNHARLRHALR